MKKDLMHTLSGTDRASAFRYLLEWEWPEHIESVLRQLLFLSLCEVAKGESTHEISTIDYLAAKLIWLISVHPKTSPSILHALAQQQPVAYLERIAENPNTLVKTLELLSRHPSPLVRAAVAENAKVEEQMLMRLVNDESVDVRYSIAENPHVPENILRLLVDDDNCYVSARANRTLNRLSPAQPAIIPWRQPSDERRGQRRTVQV
jgi:hypothetical protein